MRWWGWGEGAGAVTLPAAAESMLRSELSLDPTRGVERMALTASAGGLAGFATLAFLGTFVP